MKKEKVVIALGGNIGDLKNTFRVAINKLKSNGFSQVNLSSVYKTPPVDCIPNTSDFENCVISGYWNNTPESLLAICQKIELEAGRKSDHSSNESRELDLDIILFGNQIINTRKLTIPHPRAHQRFFVLIPLAEIEPNLIFKNLSQTANQLLDKIKTTNLKLFESIQETKKKFNL